ncbi:gliding motility-associated ABC transporter permease subunit GldF [Taibaiella sp. KBW10]|uniref:gliding motility-associated ABC transporter permease subunit GldF n=1 Tax=Taibaiella sp. KBW10 TaxID=2153357 RepID=UPI000F5930FC|nr:gliding motility-associated ABC transporter permease subunit GldF [Taibaiella sp. KBW10]RQO30094.1 gliding motility-associated ABC transporter permease subunit GldF [Taibaiella sp. KBW10]
MKSIYLKELSAFLSSVVGYAVLFVFLIVLGLFLWVLPDSNFLDYGYASMEQFFKLTPWLLLFLIPAVTMRSFADEFKGGTIEWLSTKPLTLHQIIGGKFWASFTLVVIALIPTLVYVFAINWLAIDNATLDFGAIAGAYVGLILLIAAFVAIGIFSSTLTDNQIVGFLLAVILCWLLYSGFEAISRMPVFAGGADYYIQLIGMDAHYNSINRGVINTKDVIYFLSVTAIFWQITLFTLKRKRLQ